MCTSSANAPLAATPVPLSVLADQITELCGHLNAAQHRWLMLIAEFDRREGWGDGSTQSCAHWLSWKCGIDRGAAREKVRVARALESLPLISAAMARGALSYSKVRAMTRVATPEVEATLLMIAEHGTADHVETLVRQFRRAQQSVELSREAMQQANRALRYYFDDDGSLVVQARLPAQDGALLLRALDQAVQSPDDLAGVPAETAAADVSAETGHFFDAPSNTLSQRRADALARFAESYLCHGLQAVNGGDRHQIVVHVDAQSLAQGAPGRCELDEGPSLAVNAVRRIACDASLVTITEDARGNPLDVGRKTRTIGPSLLRALRARDRGCRFPGCTHRRFVDGHHIEHWADGGHTSLSNLVLLCRFHHRQVHEGRAVVRVLDDGAVHFADAGGRAFDACDACSGDAGWLVDANRGSGLDIDTETAVSRWCGDRMDHGMAVEGLLRQQARGAVARALAGAPSP